MATLRPTRPRGAELVKIVNLEYQLEHAWNVAALPVLLRQCYYILMMPELFGHYSHFAHMAQQLSNNAP